MTARPGVDAQMIGQPGLRHHPVLDRDHRKIRAVAFAGFRIDRQRSGRTITAAEVVDPDDEEALGVERLARPDQVVPPAQILRIVGVNTGDVMTAGKRVTDQYGIGTCRVERAVGFESEFEPGQDGAAFQRHRFIETDPLRDNDSDRIF